jgi:hypothetical protein
MKYEINGWCFFEFELSQIMKTEKGDITEVSNGYIRTSTGTSFNDRCFPLDLKVKYISDIYSNWSHKLHKQGIPSLNFPDIHRWLVTHWVQTCEVKDSDDKVNKRFEELEVFADGLLEKSRMLKNEDFMGIRLFR